MAFWLGCVLADEMVMPVRGGVSRGEVEVPRTEGVITGEGRGTGFKRSDWSMPPANE